MAARNLFWSAFLDGHDRRIVLFLHLEVNNVHDDV